MQPDETSSVDEKEGLALHPIQLLWVGVKELHMRSRTRGSHRDKVDPGQFSFMNGHNEFDPADKSISVSVLAEIGDEKHSDNLPFHLRVELVGHFAVMDDKFDASKIEIWAEKIAP